ncbi:aspartate aminotransferase family protein [Gynuella sunshinyii]|uniref:Adenosylmethionine-8-amino-7-oxononanoate aminotransferase n=1 Tax=Gynuella sunshinyii YC6258 TaxID=1445510 RepID=A0A0C5VT86_9GAMM|nr:aspartate aminotransferase family protein [Gynuella sunshinyii]AJQ97887.1 adenosylmethionine-8-amino-7-oxononanoate aminotransferase [Gynuella sunshinyii YC6258]
MVEQSTIWQAMDAAHHLHPFVDNGALAREGARMVTRAEGVYIWDAEGRQYLDAFAGLWCVNLGYGRPELAEAAARQMNELPYYNLFFKSSNVPAARLAQTLAELAPAHINHVFFTNSGSEANDTVFRMVRYFWALKGHPDKKVIIGRQNGYHGSTVAGASLGGMKSMHRQGGLPVPGVEHIRQPYWYDEGGDLSQDEFGLLAARALEEKILELGADNVAAFIAEPIQGAGGIIIPPSTYWPEIQRIVQKYDVLLVADEVICGFGRTGEWFGCDYFNIHADLMPIAKGLSSGYLPIGGVMVADHIAETLKQAGEEFSHGFTYSGHPVCAAVALENLRILKEERIIEQVRSQTAPYLQMQLQTLADHPLVGQIRGVGMLAAIELVADKHSRRRYDGNGRVGALCRDLALKQGLILRATGDTMLISPPLTITRDEINILVERAGQALDATQAALESES